MVTLSSQNASACMNACECVFDVAMVTLAPTDLGLSGPLSSPSLLALAPQLVADGAAAGSNWFVYMSSDMLSGSWFILADS